MWKLTSVRGGLLRMRSHRKQQTTTMMRPTCAAAAAAAAAAALQRQWGKAPLPGEDETGEEKHGGLSGQGIPSSRLL